MTEPRYNYDVALSFAGEDRDYVEQVAQYLGKSGVRVFYDKAEQINLWGKDLYVHLDEVYRAKARYCIMFISKSYKEKLWTNHERESAQARAFEEKGEYILPARFDDTEIPGIRPTIGYINLRLLSPQKFGQIILKKIGKKTTHKEPMISSGEQRGPERAIRAVNPYQEAIKFIEYLKEGLEKRCESISEGGVAFATFNRDGRTCIRIMRHGETKYSLDIWLGGIRGDSSISFYSGFGELLHFSNSACTGWGTIRYSIKYQETVIEFQNFSVFSDFSEQTISQQLKYSDFLDKLWKEIRNVLGSN